MLPLPSAVFLRPTYLITVLSFVLLFLPAVNTLTCHQCNGWSGRGYSPRKYNVPTCDNMNNMCYTTIFCVKIVDPIERGRHYVTYKSDCYYQTTMLVNATITETISNRRCYQYSDGGQPPKTYQYCFCNDRDYCNSAMTTSSSLITLSIAVLAAFCSKLIA
uniref:Protein sleepless n=1 Tax=Panagrellus redivivus TaxID=6233 RepID=A0A7E4VEN7_PANRE